MPVSFSPLGPIGDRGQVLVGLNKQLVYKQMTQEEEVSQPVIHDKHLVVTIPVAICRHQDLHSAIFTD